MAGGAFAASKTDSRGGRGGRGRGKGRGPPSSNSTSSPSPALLTANIKNARTLDSLFGTVTAHLGRFNHIHLSACWNTLGRLAAGADPLWFQRHAKELESLAQTTAEVAETSAEAGGGAHPPLFAALAKSATERAADFVAADLANLAWAFANAGHVEDAPLFAALARAAEARLSDFTAEELDNADWAFSRAGAWTSREADASLDSRKQGYGHEKRKPCAILGFFGEAFGDKSKVRRESDASGRFIHIPRQKLRARVVEQLRPGTIRWGSKLRSFECRRGAGVAALLVGSDGIFSTVRRQLAMPGDRLHYVGLVVVLGILDGIRRIFETVDGTTRLYAMPFTTSSTMWQLSFPCSEEAARTLTKDAAALKAELLSRCRGWHDPIPALLADTPLDGMSGYPVYDREVLEPADRVTLIGDAAHPMTPFKAQGANQALSDAVLLAEALVQGVREHGALAGLDAALPLFERRMLSRSARVVVGSREKAKELHSSLALQPGRKVQRDTGVDMPRVVRALRAGGIGSGSATDPRGLDAVVAETAGEAGLRRKRLRKLVLRLYLRHLSRQPEAAREEVCWWRAHPAELQALFRKHLRAAKGVGLVRTQGKMVRAG
ncbi:hypothetical protein EMIHUDRAFT_201654 [Emiliania huxleyi CCMP1516]|uniref:FAD-binding domain-containing protein n=2 Tax=Emiliania huxleyi TaxID=2903 RepID=A0A0D3KIC9_EMIH1|nr:hypothetical protein EMIHUDRAFT_201654 [Emiliania huxleyi CCMP1516]EOD35514.1 hypothetical protein EMIHUDRAFT_201654 [Emiliania huxleyi CCMP1516]|eukprot:XP_005787943.1 hypothetical protein EMIHUDRAFT_201654 [Emiliania huxleyi CCMP1516]